MFEEHRRNQFKAYISGRATLIKNADRLISLEEYFTHLVADRLTQHRHEIQADYNEASYLFPFWQNYPPDERGRRPVGDQYPWIEVGEHTLGRKIARLLTPDFQIREPGIPVGPDERFIVSSEVIRSLTGGFTDSAWLFIDVKSVGPRDDQPHAVMSHNQISGNGSWVAEPSGVENDVLIAKGRRTSHDFYPTVPPLYVLSDGTVAPVIHLVLKPIYKMLCLDGTDSQEGQPLDKITLATIPNGLLLTVKPNYLRTYPDLLFPGKDDKGKNPLKVRARVSFERLAEIAAWRVHSIVF